MGRTSSSIVVAAVLCGASLAVLPFSGGAGAAPSKVGWSAWEKTAITALDNAGDGPVTSPGSSTSVASTTVTSGTGVSVDVLQRSFPATGNGDQVVVAESLLDDTQLVVTEADLVTGNEDILVLQPTTDSVQSARTLKGRTMRVDVNAAGSGNTNDFAGGCNVGEWPPSVVGSAYGPLIAGTSGVACADPVTIGLISGLYEFLASGSRQISSAGSSQYGYDLYVTAWAACTPASGDTYFQTAGLWSVNGVLQSGPTSAWTLLACAPS